MAKDQSPEATTQKTVSAQNLRTSRRGINFLVLVGGVLLFCFFVAIAYFGRPMIIPLIIAVVLWYLINLLATGLQSIRFAAGVLPRWLALVLSFAAIFVGLWLIYAIVASNAAAAMAMLLPQSADDGATISQPNLARLVPSELLETVRDLVNALPEWMGITVPTNAEFTASLSAIFDNLRQSIGVFWSPTRQALGQLTATATTFALVLLYMVFIFMEQGTFEKKVRALTATEQNHANWRRAVGEVKQKVQTYVVIKSVMSLLTAVISLAVYWVFGVQFALFWALMVFVLNFIPVIGSIIAWFLPMVVVVFFSEYTLVQMLGIGFLLLSAQQLVGSIIEPRVAGEALSLSPLVIQISLAFWGALLGLLGLFLAVPLTVMLTSILSHFQGTRWIAILLSRNGQLNAQ